jgi:hypothetical protein
VGLHSNGNNADIFYAKSATALAADTVTATYGGTSSNASLWIFSVAGENFATPFDPNGSVPAATQQNFGSHATIGTTITTNKHRDLVFNVLCATQGAFNSNPTPPTGYSVFFLP